MRRALHHTLTSVCQHPQHEQVGVSSRKIQRIEFHFISFLAKFGIAQDMLLLVCFVLYIFVLVEILRRSCFAHDF